MKSEIIQCTRCVLDTGDDPSVIIGESGVCNYCTSYFELAKPYQISTGRKEQILRNIIDQMKLAGKGKKYDCVLGISGGVDSSYMAWWAAQESLRPLVVHLDNGWNSELAVKNIESVCSRLKFDLYTHVIDWEEFRDLQLAYLRASVVDIEALTDHAIYALLLKSAVKNNIKYILSGFNIASEGIMPKGWVHNNKTDFRNIRDIALRFGNIKQFKTFPSISFTEKLFYHFVHKIETVQVLNYLNYDKEKAKILLINKLGWKDYGGKHYESIFTKFYQQYILPVKFGIDKRKAHLSTLICSGQITKKQALDELAKPLYNPHQLEEDKQYVIKKFGLSEQEFDAIMKLTVRKHLEFDSDQKLWDTYFNIIRFLRPWKR